MQQTNLQRARFDELFEKLIKKGEDRDELGFWSEIFDSLTIEEQQKLIANLEKELAAL